MESEDDPITSATSRHPHKAANVARAAIVESIVTSEVPQALKLITPDNCNFIFLHSQSVH